MPAVNCIFRVNVSASYNDGSVVICVVNRNKDKAIAADITSQQGDFSEVFKVYEITGPDIKATNDFGKENVRTIQKPDIKARGNTLNYSFPPHSVTMIKGMIVR